MVQFAVLQCPGLTSQNCFLALASWPQGSALLGQVLALGICLTVVHEGTVNLLLQTDWDPPSGSPALEFQLLHFHSWLSSANLRSKSVLPLPPGC